MASDDNPTDLQAQPETTDNLGGPQPAADREAKPKKHKAAKTTAAKTTKATSAKATKATAAKATKATAAADKAAAKTPRKRTTKKSTPAGTGGQGEHPSAAPDRAEGQARGSEAAAPTEPTELDAGSTDGAAGTQSTDNAGTDEASAPTLGIIFQPPVAPRRRRASAPAMAPPPPAPVPTSTLPDQVAVQEAPAKAEAAQAADDSAETAVGSTLDAPPHDGGESADVDEHGEHGEQDAHEQDAHEQDDDEQDDDEHGDDEQDDDVAQSSQDAQPSDDAPRRRRRRGGKGRRSRADKRGSRSGSHDGSVDGSDDDAGPAEGFEDNADHGRQPAGGDAQPRRGGAGQAADTSEDAAAVKAADTAADEEPESSTRRRRRRRRSGGGSGDSDTGSDSPGVTTRVRESRRDEVTALKGSTRLEAKKQRRREGREAGRRRTVITEAEFLARRESVERVMVVRRQGERTQIGVLEEGVLAEHYISRETTVSMAGNIYLGRVQNVLPSMEAAFVDIGKGRNAVLYAGEVNWDAAGLGNNQPKRIENALSSGETVLVQVTKDPIGHKGARLTSQISLPGRYLVYVPNSTMTGISRKLPENERARLKKILKEVLPETSGVIVRTAAEGASEEELRADVQRLTAEWDEIKTKADAAGGGRSRGKAKTQVPALLHGEPDLTVRVIRDIFNEDFGSLVVEGDQAWAEVSDYVGSVAPDLVERLHKWTGEQDLFAHYRVDEQIAKAMDRKVWLPSGGSLVIDRTEAMTVIDVNTGKFIGSGGNLEETVTKNNLESAEEIVRQLRLRDIGGIIVIDFIDMVLESNRDLVVRRLLECLGRDRTKHQVAEVTSLGLVQMTRKRVGSGLIEVFSEACEHCSGRGFIIHSEPVDRSPEPADSVGQGSRGTAPRGRGRGDSAPASGSSASSQPGSSARSTGGSNGGSTRAGGTARTNGPTPAQIAAAAHAAAMKTAGQILEATEATEATEAMESADPGAGAVEVLAVEAFLDGQTEGVVAVDVLDELDPARGPVEAEVSGEAVDATDTDEDGAAGADRAPAPAHPDEPELAHVPLEPAEPVEGAEPVESAQPAEGAEPVDGAEPAESADAAESAETGENAQPAQPVDGEPVDSGDHQDAVPTADGPQPSVAPSRGRGRHRHGRVVAPAGPPRAAVEASRDGGQGGPAPASEG